ncbi:unnamed protein product [Caenorhabditis bovis]|uniref:Deoxyribonuclease TATDN1 n=1 Tax=Caenorhabditis bovis TaxID=2654633 RepID=A0A8S1EBK5_9PELO|nr:unnamed protein product [Caenorhabditis bovis]
MSATGYDLVDIGANLGHPSYKDDIDEVLSRAKEAGVGKIMVTGTSEIISEQCEQLVQKYPGFLYFTAGVHPHDAKHWNDSTLETLRRLQKSPSCVAVGECGLDYNRDFSPRDVQRDVFRKQVQLAIELQKPLFIHEREASEDMVKILEEAGQKLPPAVIHCFTGTVDEAKKYIEMGFFIGLTGFLWKDKSENGVQAGLRSGDIPIEKLVIETDAPYMYPKITDKKLPKEIRDAITEETKRLHKFSSFNRNEPASLAAVCELIAGFSGKSPEEVAKITTQNAKRIYGLN